MSADFYATLAGLSIGTNIILSVALLKAYRIRFRPPF